MALQGRQLLDLECATDAALTDSPVFGGWHGFSENRL